MTNLEKARQHLVEALALVKAEMDADPAGAAWRAQRPVERSIQCAEQAIGHKRARPQITLHTGAAGKGAKNVR